MQLKKMRLLFSLNLLCALCLAARGEESPDQKQPENKDDSLPLLVYPSYELQRQPIMMERNNLNYLFPVVTSIVTTTSTVTCTYSTAAQCIGRRRRDLMIANHDDYNSEKKPNVEEAEHAVMREERKADPTLFLGPYYHQYHPTYLIEPSFERSSYYQLQRRYNPFVAQPPEMARFLFGVGFTFTSTSTIVTTSSWRPVCAFPGTFQSCQS